MIGLVYLCEGARHHAFPIQALLLEHPAPVVTTSRAQAARLVGAPEVHVVPPAGVGERLAALGARVIISSSQRLRPEALRRRVPGLVVAYCGHGDSDKTHAGNSPRPHFVDSPDNDAFDLMLFASPAHFHRSTHRARAWIGNLRHDLWCRRPARAPAPDLVLWAPGWGRHSAVRPWLDPVIEVTAELGRRLVLHLHPHSYEVEQSLARRVRAAQLRHAHLTVAQVADLHGLMSEAAVMLGDVSSVCHDWLQFDRPLVFLDHAHLCLAAERALFPVGRVVRDADELRAALTAPDDRSPARRAAFAARFPALDGQAAARALDAVQAFMAGAPLPGPPATPDTPA